MFKNFNKISGFALTIMAVVLCADIAGSQTAPALYAQLKGTVRNDQGRPVGGIAVTLKPTVYAYGAHNYIAVSDLSGRYEIKNIARYVYSSGSAPKWVDYYISVSSPGYADYVSNVINFQNSTSIKMDIKLAPAKKSYRRR